MPGVFMMCACVCVCASPPVSLSDYSSILPLFGAYLCGRVCLQIGEACVQQVLTNAALAASVGPPLVVGQVSELPELWQ